jgi:hypothetical protein
MTMSYIINTGTPKYNADAQVSNPTKVIVKKEVKVVVAPVPVVTNIEH